MKKTKLNYRFHNSVAAEETVDLILKIFIEANANKVEQAVKSAAEELHTEEKRSA